MIDLQLFGRRVAQMRERRRLSVQELADRVGTSYQSLWRIERGRQGNPGLLTAARLAQVLECSLDYLVGLYETEEKAA
jgi:transcriptional regulator with XRE-family HTH domain